MRSPTKYRRISTLFENWNKAHIRRYFVDAIPKGKQLDYNQPAVQGVHYWSDEQLAELAPWSEKLQPLKI